MANTKTITTDRHGDVTNIDGVFTIRASNTENTQYHLQKIDSSGLAVGNSYLQKVGDNFLVFRVMKITVKEK